MGLLADIQMNITEGAETYAPIIHQPFEQFSPAYQIDQTYSPSIFIESPESQGAIITTKKQATQTPSVGGVEVEAPTTAVASGDIMGTILLISIIAVVGYVVVAGIKKKKK